jgi:hypothetical protein
MTTSQREFKIAFDAPISPFDWNSCPKKFHAIFLNLISSQGKILNLKNQNLTGSDVLVIRKFLSAYPHITTLDISGNYLSNRAVRMLISTQTLEELKINDNMPLEPYLLRSQDPDKLLAARNSDIMRQICAESCKGNNVSCLLPSNPKRLKRLELRNSFLQDTDVGILANMKTLQFLDIRDNSGISVDGVQPLMNTVEQFKKEKLTFLRGTFQRHGDAPLKILSEDLLDKIFGYLSFHVLKGPFPAKYALDPLVSLNLFTHKTNIFHKAFRWFFPKHTTPHPTQSMQEETKQELALLTPMLLDDREDKENRETTILNAAASIHAPALSNPESGGCSSSPTYTPTREQQALQGTVNRDPKQQPIRNPMM